jgi:hypothetical protein
MQHLVKPALGPTQRPRHSSLSAGQDTAAMPNEAEQLDTRN